MRNKIRLALFALCTAVVSGTAELHADERIPAAAARQTAEASQYDIVYQENHTHTIAPAGETFSLDLLSVAQKMYTAIGLPDGPLLGYGVETRLTGLQQLQFGTDWTEGKTALTLDFKPNNGMDALSNTLDIYVIANTTSTGGIRPAALVRVTFSQAPVTVYSTGAIQGLRMEETTYNGTMQTKKVSHFDRAGRLVQETALSASPSGNDIIRFYRYDCMNRGDSVTYLPYTLEETGGSLRENPEAEQKAFYREYYTANEYNFAYSSKEYDTSPLGVPVKSGGPGREYSIDGGSAGHYTAYIYGRNTALEVYKYTVALDGSFSCSTRYAAGTLLKTQSAYYATDGVRTLQTEYRDSEGRLVAKSTVTGNENPRFTCYAYDELGRLRYVIPPIVHEQIKGLQMSITPASASYKKYWYYYEYDRYGRTVVASKPGKADEYFVYDKQGRMVLSQDGNLRAANAWFYYIYDTQDRVLDKCIVREKTPGSLTRASIQERYYADGFDNTYPYLGGTDTPLVPFSGSLFVLQAHLESARYDDYDIYPQHTEAPAAFTRYRENLYLYMPHAFSMESYGIRDIPGMWTYFVDGGTVKPEYAVKNGTTVVPGYYYIPENMVQTVQNIFIKINTPGLFNLVTKFPGSGYPDLGSYPEGRPAVTSARYVEGKYFKIGSIAATADTFPSVYDPQGKYFENCATVRSEYKIKTGYYYIPEACLELVERTVALGGPYEIVTAFPGSGTPLKGIGLAAELMSQLAFEPYAGIASADMLAPTNRGRMTFQQLAVVSPQETDNNIYRAYYYDRKGRVILTKELDREGNPSCYWVKYDDAGHILTTVEEHRIPDSNLPDFKRVDYTYDAQGRMLNETTTVDREGSAIRSVSTFVYDEFDRLSSKTTDGTTESYGHDFYGRLTGQASPYFRQELSYAGRYDGYVTATRWKHSNSPFQCYGYTYDGYGQLTAAYHLTDDGQRDMCFDEEATYDLNGNILTMARTGAAPSDSHTYTYTNDGNRLVGLKEQDGPTYAYAYDANGNMQYDARKGLIINYNFLNLPVIVTGSDNQPKALYTWLPDGTKVECHDSRGNGFRYKGSFTYDMQGRLLGIDFGSGQFYVTTTQNGTRDYMPLYHITDYLGSVRVVYNDEKFILARNDFYPFGLRYEGTDYLLNEIPRVNRFLFNGKEYQLPFAAADLGLLDYGARMYDPVIGRWTTQDPAMQFTNPYIFCGNNPVQYIDPDGEWILGALLGGIFNLTMDLLSGNPNKDSKWYEWAASFGIGAATGVLGFYASTSLASFGAGGFLNGLGTGFITGFSGGFLSETSRGLFRHQGLATSLRNGLNQGLSNGLVGAAIGGIVSGIAAVTQGRSFWNGAERTNRTIVDRQKPYIRQDGQADCGGACAESASNGAVTQQQMRQYMGGGDKNTTGYADTEFWKKYSEVTGTPYNLQSHMTPDTYIEKMIEGYDIAFSIPAAPNDYGITHHAVLANKAVEQTVIRVNGKKIVKTLFYIMDPNRGQYCRFDFKHLQPRAFLLSPQ